MKRIVAISILLLVISMGPTCRAAPSSGVYLPVLFGLPGSGPAVPPDADPTPEAPTDEHTQPIEGLVALINEARAARGLEPLNPACELADAARRHTRDMADHANLSHIGSDGSTPGQRIRAARYEWLECGEVIALGPGNPRAILNVWLKSPAHCAILMDVDLYELGIGRAAAPDRSGFYWTVDLGIRLQP